MSSPNVTPMIRVTNLTKIYGSNSWALAGVSFQAHRGQVTLLMGPDGSGKTSLISILGGVLRPTSGSVQLEGQEISLLHQTQLAELRLHNIGFVFSTPNLMPTLTAAENVVLSLELIGLRGHAARDTARELLDEVGLAGYHDSRPSDLNPGQQQCVAIARALAAQPKLILADEPTAELDSQGRCIVLERLGALARGGCAVVIASNDSRMLDHADHIVELADGRVASDTADTILPEPYHGSASSGGAVQAGSASDDKSLAESQLALSGGTSMNPTSTPTSSGDPNRRWFLIAILLLLPPAFWGLLHLPSWQNRAPQEGLVVAPMTAENSTAALRTVGAAGKVEPASTEVLIGTEVAGRLLQVNVEEGQQMKAGQLIAAVDAAELRSRVAQASAIVLMRQAELNRVTSGPSRMEQQSAAAEIAEAQVILDNARAEAQQRKALLDRGEISQIEYDRASRQVLVAEAGLNKVRASAAILASPARDEERARAAANLQAAQAQLQEARAMLDKAFVRAPFDGVVLRVHHHAGEEVTPGGGPIVSFGDVSRLRVRVDVDEADVAKIHLGDKAYVMAQAYGATRFTGAVSQISGQLGRKNIETGDPAEKVDTRVLETVVDLDSGVSLPVGLRVDAFITSANE